MTRQVIQILHSILEQEILNLLFLYDFVIVFHVWYMLRFDVATNLSLLFISVRLSNSLRGSDVLLFLEFMNMVFIFVFYVFWIHFIVVYLFSNFFCLIQMIYDLSDFI